MGIERIQAAQAALADKGADHIGDLCAWNISGVDVARAKARAIFDKHGFPELIGEVAIDSALTRAAKEGRKPAKLIVRPFARPHKDSPTAIGLYEQRANEGESGDDLTCVARIRIEGTAAGLGGIVLDRHATALPPEGWVGAEHEAAMTFARDIASRANHIVDYVHTVDVSNAMLAVLERIGACPLRDRGGFYLLAPGYPCEAWRALAADLENEIGVQKIIVAMHGAPENLQAAARAATASLEADLSALRSDLKSAIEKSAAAGIAPTGDDRKARKPRTDMLDARIEECARLRSKVGLFAGLLHERASELEALFQKYGEGFAAIAQGDSVPFSLFDDEPASEPESEPAPRESAPPDSGATLAAAPDTGSSDTAWFV